MSQTILFLCPHNAAKSILAAAYFERLANQAGLDLQADSAGTEPDAAPAPPVVELLKTEGIERQFGLSRLRQNPLGIDGRFLRLMAVGDQPADDVHKAVEWASMARMLDLRNVLELVDDRFNNGSLTRQELVIQAHQMILHITPWLGKKLDAPPLSLTCPPLAKIWRQHGTASWNGLSN